jgi:nickel-dependent lactate racemase
MKIKIDYGKNGLIIEVPDNTTVLKPKHKEKIYNPEAVIMSSLSNPINSPPLINLYKKGMKVGISVCDHTRAQPRNEIIKCIMELLGNIDKENFLIFIATGSHRQSTDEEISKMFNKEILSNVTIINHEGNKDSNIKTIGETSKKTPIEINKEWLDCDLKITTGFVEPHFFAGFSGGPKMVAPGLAGLETIMNLHDYKRIKNNKSIWGVTKGNPIHEEISEISRIISVDFAIDFTLNRSQNITGVYAGDLATEHEIACKRVKRDSMIATKKMFDLVITSNSGYPLDQNLYQSIKGISAAAQITKPGGTIISVTECSDGIPNGSSYHKLLKSFPDPKSFLSKVKDKNYSEPDQWQFQIQSQIQSNNKLMIYSKLNEIDTIQSHMTKITDINQIIEGVQSKIKNPSICILPEGPQTIPYKV